MEDWLKTIDLLRVICLGAILACQVVIAYTLWLFSRHSVVAFSTTTIAKLSFWAAGLMALSMSLLIYKIWFV